MKLIIILYIAAGASIVLVGRGREHLNAAFAQAQNGAWWQRTLFYIIITPISILLWPLFFKSWGEAARTPLSPEKKAALEAIFDINAGMSAMNRDAIDEDSFKAGVGSFGLSVDNPIPCGSVFGEMAYLSSLRQLNGEKIKYIRIGSTSSRVIPMPIDTYQITNLSDDPIATIYLSPYQKRNSKLAPDGFKLEAS